MTKLTNRTKATATILLASGALSLTACTSHSPAMHTLSQRSVDRTNTMSYTIDTDTRALHTDFDRIMHLNRPSRLHYNVKPY
ncbi:MAG: hypothetical protein JJ974_08280 [Phycisphaerales bacterium]|nr:hypothetical protein [Phycisphaerales bacterium]